MSLSNDGESKIRVHIQSNAQAANTVQLVIHTRQVLKISEHKSLVNGSADFVVDEFKLGDGVSHITVFNENMQPVCERLYFRRPSNKLLIEATNGAQQIPSRAKATIQIRSKDETGKAVPADLSVSVYRIGEASPGASQAGASDRAPHCPRCRCRGSRGDRFEQLVICHRWFPPRWSVETSGAVFFAVIPRGIRPLAYCPF